MAAAAATSEIKITIIATVTDTGSTSSFNYLQGSQWLCTADLDINDDLVSTSSLMMGVGTIKSMAMVLSGFAGLISGACDLAARLSTSSSLSTPNSTSNSPISRGCRGVGESVKAGTGSGGVLGDGGGAVVGDGVCCGAQREVLGVVGGNSERSIGGVGARLKRWR
ncbi:hypothetical protein QJS04_geneDACA016696 [Acorus gramineus]|uniref:Uncharacterized protein n=1 Tax=Acorus gramineus TaxID=55184 RepID=A0AAV9ARL7_ACOGR|nr:hypothetical protein QJS04_geneDACA016696 [Acorus gramineus]